MPLTRDELIRRIERFTGLTAREMIPFYKNRIELISSTQRVVTRISLTDTGSDAEGWVFGGTEQVFVDHWQTLCRLHELPDENLP